MLDFAPCLDDIFFGIGHVVQCHVHRIFVVAQVDGGLCSALHLLRRRRYIVKISRRIPVAVCDGYCRFEIVFVARSAVHFPSPLADASVGAGMDVPEKVLHVVFMQKLFAEIRLVKASVRRHLQNQVRIVCSDADKPLFGCIRFRKAYAGQGCCQ